MLSLHLICPSRTVRISAEQLRSFLRKDGRELRHFTCLFWAQLHPSEYRGIHPRTWQKAHFGGVGKSNDFWLRCEWYAYRWRCCHLGRNR
jgi:hypothetical protein